MENKSRNNTILVASIAAVGCLVLLCAAAAIFIFLFGFSSPLTIEEAPTETITLSEAQLEQCREVMAIQADVEIEGVEIIEPGLYRIEGFWFQT